jgi:predicted nucleic acid-binding protein
VALPVGAKVVLDTNVFIDYLRVGLHANWVIGPVGKTIRFLSSVVVLELDVGADTPRRKKAVDRLKDAFPRSRVIAPDVWAFDQAGVVFRALYGTVRGDRLGLMNDILIALTARRIGAAVVTSNLGEFHRIANHISGLAVIDP